MQSPGGPTWTGFSPSPDNDLVCTCAKLLCFFKTPAPLSVVEGCYLAHSRDSLRWNGPTEIEQSPCYPTSFCGHISTIPSTSLYRCVQGPRLVKKFMKELYSEIISVYIKHQNTHLNKNKKGRWFCSPKKACSWPRIIDSGYPKVRISVW